MAPTPGRLRDHVDPVFAELVAIPDAREHQQLRTVDRAAAQHHFTPRPHHLPASAFVELDTDGTAPLEEHLGRRGFRVKSQVGALERGPQVGIRGAPPGAPALGDTCFAEAFGHSLIGFLNSITALLHGFQPCRSGRAGTSLARDGQRAGLDAAEIGLDVGVVPLFAGRLAPLVVVGGEAAHPHHRVHRRRAAEHLASWPIDLAPVELLLRLGAIVPVHLAAEELREARGDVDELVLVLGPGFEHHDLGGLIRTEPVGHHRSGRARSHDDVVGIHPPESRSPFARADAKSPDTPQKWHHLRLLAQRTQPRRELSRHVRVGSGG